jgi:hypothetical protein
MAKIIDLHDYKIIKERKEVHEKMRREGLELDPKVVNQEMDEILKLLKIAKNTASQIKQGEDHGSQE